MAAVKAAKSIPKSNGSTVPAVIPDVNADIKAKAGALKGACGVGNQMNREKFKRHLVQFITSDTNIYTELVAVIF
jgi:hypothetical protein